MADEEERDAPMSVLEESVARLAADTTFSGVVRVDRNGEVELAAAYGWAHRAWQIPNTTDTRFGIASGTKGLTALAVVSLIEEGRLDLSTPARSVLGTDLPLIAEDVTVEHLLGHRSGIGDYLDEDIGYDVEDYVLTVPVHELATTEDYVRILDGFPTKFAAGERFAYCNGGYVVLALIAERVSGSPFAELVTERVCRPAGMADTAFLRSDSLPERAAVGYLDTDGPRSNVFHLPVVGTGDGGVYTTAADVQALWDALFAGRIVSPDVVREMVRPRSVVPTESMRYGLGFWLHESGPAVMLVGGDAGVSFRSVHDPERGLTHTVLSNTTAGAWPITRGLDELLGVSQEPDRAVRPE
jgi:CubicO group peptidase (beta-lactamase class C family)